MSDENIDQSQESTIESANLISEDSVAATNEPGSWYSEEHASYIESKGFKDPNDVIKSYANLERMVGNSVRIPPADASEEAKKEFYQKISEDPNIVIKGSEDFYNKLGRPETSKDYKLQDIIDSQIAQALPDIHNDLDNFQNIAHDIGLNNEQAAKLVEMRMGEIKAQYEQQAMYRQQAEQELHTMWGPDYQNRLNAAKQMANIYAEQYPDAMAELIHGPSGNNPALLNMLSELASEFKEKGHAGLVNSQFGMTPDQALSKIADKKADIGFMEAYTNYGHPGHKKAVADLEKLYAIANNIQ